MVDFYCQSALSNLSIPMSTYIPKSSPSKQVWMVDLALGINVLPWPHHHVLGRGHVDQGRFAGVGVGYP